MINFALRYKPLKYLISFNLFTIFIFLTAPLRWETDNFFLFFVLVACCQLALFVGFRNGSKYALKIKRKVGAVITDRTVNLIFVFYGLTFLIKYAYWLKFYPTQVLEMFNFLLVGVISPDIGYQMTLDTTRAFTIPWSLYFLISIVNQVFFIVGFLTWKRNGKWLKLFFIIFIVIEFFFWFGRGTNFGIIALITTFVFAKLIKSDDNKKNAKNSVFLALMVLISVFAFTYNLNNRRGGADVDVNDFDLVRATVDINHPSLQIIPAQLHSTYMYVVSYLSQGYYHTALAMDLDYVPTFFLGNNPATIDFAELLNINIIHDIYSYRLRIKGVDPEVNWHSAYTWYASDVTFFGVPLVFYILGYIFGSSWILSRKYNDFLSQIIFVILCNMLLFTFANNNYLSYVFYSFFIILPYWYLTRLKRIIK